MIEIRKATAEDYDAVWNIIKEVIATGDTYIYAPDSSKEKMIKEWFGENKYTYIALLDNKIAGTFFIKQNQPDLGSHVANAGYMTAPAMAGKGIGRAMAAFSLKEAKRLGFEAMQFNMVVKSNERAVQLWKKLGFEIIGELPAIFNHRQLGLTNAYIMYKKL